ncbi:MAG TPA: tol-pal system protein YbgF [Vicinamibacteria bacterium]|nr:tol-pal system protein YbgF [Vicinamibacteria bacterium]
MLRRVTLLMCALAATLATPFPALAANKDIERLQIQISSLQGQLADLQRVSEDTLKELKRLNESLAEQSASTRRLVADRRVQEEAISAALKDINDRVSDMSERMQAGMAGAAAAPPAANPAAAVPPTVAGGPAAAPITPGAAPAPAVPNPQAPAPRELYTQAYADYARGNYDLAIQEYTDYLRNYPDTDLSDNAQYWIGECQYSKQKYPEAIEAWDELLRQYPSSDKIPDARFKKGMALERLGRRSQALLEYRFVAERFPNSEAGRKAREKLNPR